MATDPSRMARWLDASQRRPHRLAPASTRPRFHRRWFSLLLAAMLILGSMALALPAQRALAAPAWTTTDLNLRAEPTTRSAVILVMEPGAYVEIVQDKVNGFYRVRYNGVSGWANAAYLDRGGSSSGGDTEVLDSLNLRAGPSTADGVLAVMGPGDYVTVTGGPVNGFYSVIFAGIEGWAFGAYLAGYSSGTGVSTVQEDLNLRAGPSTADDVITVMLAGATVELTGLATNGYVSVEYQGMDGWAFADYLGDGTPSSGSTIDTAWVTDWLNLRDAAGTWGRILTVLSPGDEVAITGGASGGFYPVSAGGQRGWASADYLDFDWSFQPASGGSGIIWPVSGGEWEITQGYHGPYSHYNASSTYQYAYSLDLARTDGGTAGQAVYSPVNGTVRWTERGSGGISIDMGNGYAVALFHVTLDGGLGWGDPVSQGQYLGYVSGPGGDGYAGFAHVHFSLWQTTDGGNWSRSAVPFTGANAIAGWDLPDAGGSNQYAGTVFYP